MTHIADVTISAGIAEDGRYYLKQNGNLIGTFYDPVRAAIAAKALDQPIEAIRSGRIRYLHQRFNWGKYYGITLEEVILHDPKYILFMMNNMSHRITLSEPIKRFVKRRYAENKINALTANSEHATSEQVLAELNKDVEVGL